MDDIISLGDIVVLKKADYFWYHESEMTILTKTEHITYGYVYEVDHLFQTTPLSFVTTNKILHQYIEKSKSQIREEILEKILE